ncbi:hypothetical protein LIA77_08655 [Sarocladium implicatum]|nr:hypothetical protein LIA77_08655 [Sarocladium implicatum]
MAARDAWTEAVSWLVCQDFCAAGRLVVIKIDLSWREELPRLSTNQPQRRPLAISIACHNPEKTSFSRLSGTDLAPKSVTAILPPFKSHSSPCHNRAAALTQPSFVSAQSSSLAIPPLLERIGGVRPSKRQSSSSQLS